MTSQATVADRSTALLPDPEQSPTVALYPTTARALGLGRSAVYAAAQRGDIPTIRIGSRLVVPTAALRRMLQLDAEPLRVLTHDADA